MRPPPGERPRDRLGRPLPRGAPSEIAFEDYAANSVDENLRRGLEHFGHGRFFQAHEAWEEAWRQARGSSDEELLKGLAQLGAGYTHIARGNARGARALLDRALERLRRYPPHHRNVTLSAAIPLITAQRTSAAEAEHEGRRPLLLTLPNLEGPTR